MFWWYIYVKIKFDDATKTCKFVRLKMRCAMEDSFGVLTVRSVQKTRLLVELCMKPFSWLHLGKLQSPKIYKSISLLQLSMNQCINALQKIRSKLASTCHMHSFFFYIYKWIVSVCLSVCVCVRDFNPLRTLRSSWNLACILSWTRVAT
jgi:hypothetical protein